MNITALHTHQIAAGCFGKPSPPPPTGEVTISYNPQDSVVLQPGTITLKGVGRGPSVDKAKISGRGITPENGSYVFPESDPRYHAANALATVAHTIDVFEQASGKPIKWAFKKRQIKILPDAGRALNAFYARGKGALVFFHDKDSLTQETVYSADSGEVVSHETGHAILDSLRPSYLGTWSLDPGGFHESFGDVLAMLVALKDDRVINKVVEQTQGNLRKSNIIANLGEELGMAINHNYGNVTGGDYTRTAINNFVWKDPRTLPRRGGPDELTREVHSYSRLWTGAMYDVFEGIVKSYEQSGQSFAQALRSAADECLHLYAALMKYAPHGDFTYKDMAEALLVADNRDNEGKRSDLIRQVFTKRKILPENFQLTDAKIYTGKTKTISIKLQGEQYGQFEGAKVETVIDDDGDLLKIDSTRNHLAQDMLDHIKEGRILFTTPDQHLTDQDYFDKNGRPYLGVVRWESGEMTIERIPIVS